MDIYLIGTPHRTSWTPRSRASKRALRPAESSSSSTRRTSEQDVSFPTGAALLESSRGVPSTRPTAITDQRRSPTNGDHCIMPVTAEFPTDGDGPSGVRPTTRNPNQRQSRGVPSSRPTATSNLSITSTQDMPGLSSAFQRASQRLNRSI